MASAEEEGWNCEDEEECEEMKSRLRVAKMLLLVGRPIENVLNELGMWEFVHMDGLEEVIRRRARVHLKEHTEHCKKQAVQGLHYVREHPAAAHSWDSREMRELLSQPGVARLNVGGRS